MTDHPTSRDITADFDKDVFVGLADRELDAISVLMARASERAYRRGFQQGAQIGGSRPEDMRANLAAWRYGPSTDDAPWADGARIEPSADRLFAENKGLVRLRLRVPMSEAIAGGLRHDPSYQARG